MKFYADFEHRDELLASALDEFSEHGYDAASINRVLAAAHMSKGQLYHHFSDKETLYLAVIEWMIEEKTRWIASQPLHVNVNDFFDVIRQNIVASMQFALAHPEVERFTRAMLAERGRPIFDTVTRRFAFNVGGVLSVLVAHHYASGAFRPELSLRFVTQVVILTVNNLPELLDIHGPAELHPQVDELVAWLRLSIGRP